MLIGTRRRSAVAISAVALLALSACGGGDDGSKGSEGEIVIGGTGAMTGSAAGLKPMLDGAMARIDEANAAGGVGGFKIKYVTRDDQYNPAQTPQQMRQLVEDDGIVLACNVVGTPTYASVNDYLGSKGVLGIPASGSNTIVNDHTYLVLPDYENLGRRIVDYAVDTLGVKTFSIAYTPDDVGEPFLAGVKGQLESHGLSLETEVEFDPTAKDFSTQAAKLKDAGAEMVFITHVPATQAQVQNAATKIGYSPKWGSTMTSALVQLAELAPEAAANTSFAVPLTLPDAPEAKAFQESMKEYAPDATIDGVYAIEGYSIAETCLSLIEKAIDANGGKSPSAADILAAAEGLKVDSEYVHGLDWTGTHQGMQESQILALQDGKFVSVDGFKAPAE